MLHLWIPRLCFGILVYSLLFADEEKPAKVALKPLFQMDRVWSQSLNATILWSQAGSLQKATFDFTMEGEITELQEQLPIKIKYSHVTGPQCFFRGDTLEDEMKNEDGTILGEIGTSFTVKSAKDVGKLSNDVLTMFPAGPFFGFLPPTQDVGTGDVWNSGEVMPLGPRSFSKKQFQFTEPKGEFKLESIQDALANIVWTGSAVVTMPKNALKGKVTWEHRIQYDLKTAWTSHQEGKLVMEFENGLSVTYALSSEIKLK